ncbi:MAG: hypothetical protein JO244_05870, partial [Solirubrobacterales bacterium]|nr:hypothetical protein [Solirubrobacterales bacterium]
MQSVRVTEKPGSSGAESRRVAEARARAADRLRTQRGTLRPLGGAIIVVVALGVASGHPRPSLHGVGLGLTLSFCVFAVTLLFAITGRFPGLGHALQAGVISIMGASGIALAALQPRDATSLAGAAAVWMAVARLPEVLGAVVVATVTAGLTIAAAVAGAS